MALLSQPKKSECGTAKSSLKNMGVALLSQAKTLSMALLSQAKKSECGTNQPS